MKGILIFASMVFLISLETWWPVRAETVTIENGILRLPEPGNHKLVPETGDVDEVRRIDGLQEDETIVLSLADGSTRIFVRDDGLFILLQQRQDFELNHEADRIRLVSTGGGRVIEISRSSGGD